MNAPIRARTKGERSDLLYGYAMALEMVERSGTEPAREWLRVSLESEQRTSDAERRDPAETTPMPSNPDAVRRWTVWRVRMGSFAGEWRATERPHSPEALGIRQVEMVEVMPAAEHHEIVAAARKVRAAFDAGEWPLGPSYKAVQGALRRLDDVLEGSR